MTLPDHKSSVYDTGNNRSPILLRHQQFLRFHGTKGDDKGSYSDEWLEEYASWLRAEQTVFACCNNTIGKVVHNALFLKKIFPVQ